MIGAGYVGLVSGACFSEFGWQVTCIDKDSDKIERLKNGEVPIYEPGLEELIDQNVKAGRLSFTTDLSRAARDAELIFLAVGTPMRRNDGYADLSYIYESAKELAPYLEGFTVITTKSTVPVGTSREIERQIKAIRPDADIAICSNPEFLREGSAIRDFLQPDRVLIGYDDFRARDKLQKLYHSLEEQDVPVMFVSRESAELSKYAANSFLAMKISFINEIADLCERVGADIQDVSKAIGSDKRIGPKFLQPGPGYGGSCFPKDVSSLARTAREVRVPLTIVEQVDKVNNDRKIAMACKVEEVAGGSVRDKKIAVLGVTFKPDTDDMRDAPSLVILPLLQDKGAIIRACDPEGEANAKKMLPGVQWFPSALDAARDADIVLILTEWNSFREISLDDLKVGMAGNVMADLRNIYEPEAARNAGFDYFGIGRK
jgi:UDPglucose 6-dehydrogenase